MNFKINSKFQPTGDQPRAIEQLTRGLQNQEKDQVLLGVTGSGKTFSIANVIQNIQKPTLVISHNKTLAGQLYQELRDFFPQNAVSYFVSYYDYYQPEAYVPTTDTYIAKETEINEEIDKLRLAATTNLLTRKDTIVVASVSCIYNLGSPIEYERKIVNFERGMKMKRDTIMEKLMDLMYTRNDYNYTRGTFRVRGELIDVQPAYEDFSVRLTLGGDTIDSIKIMDPLNGDVIADKEQFVIYPAKHYMTDPAVYENVFDQIKNDMTKQVELFKASGKLVESERILRRTEYDLKMLKEVGYVNGVENYSRYFDGRQPGDAPYSLLEFFRKAAGEDWLLVVDESHMTVPQIRGMYNGDRARKMTLIDYGFRLPSALDNRPLKAEEFWTRVNRTIFVSATPNEWEMKRAGKDNVAQQLIRPTGIVDPEVEIRKTEGQIVDLLGEIKKATVKGERVLVTTLTKRMSEDLTTYLVEQGIKVAYLHSEIDTLKRQDILDELRSGTHDVIVGINLLREGLDLPEVAMVAILDADKEGFLRSRTALVQTMGRAARRIDSKVILYADKVTDSMKAAILEVERRRRYQLAYNKEHNITPISVQKDIRSKLIEREEEPLDDIRPMMEKEHLLPDERKKVIKRLREEMGEAARVMDFETAALLRDKIRYLQKVQ